jgi:nucleotide-binding universal stress UspA family protein
MLKKILLSLDGSENAEKALPWVKQYANREHAQVILLRAVVTKGLTPDTALAEVQSAKEYLQGIERELNYAGIPVKMILKKYAPVRAILDAAMAEGCDLILMSTRGGSPVERWAIGGVTEQVLRLSPIPVLVIRSHTVLPRQGHVRRIIVPVDGSKLAEAVVSWSGRLAQLLKARLVFVHVSPRGPASRSASARSMVDLLQRRIKRACDGLAKEGVKASFSEQFGDPADRLLQFADANDLILTTTHGAGGFKRWVFGSVAEKLIHAASIPVLVYKTAAQGL